MSAMHPLLRPAMVIERAVLTAGDAGTVTRAAAVAVGAWKRRGFVCVALHCAAVADTAAADAHARVRAEITRQRHIDAALRGFGGFLDGTYACPRPGETVDADVPGPSRFARLIIEAATAHRIDRARSLVIARSADAIDGARIAGLRCVLVAAGGKAGNDADDGETSGRASPRADFVVADLGEVLALIEAPRARAGEGAV